MTFDNKGQQQVVWNDYYQYVPIKIFYLTNEVFIYPLNKKLKALWFFMWFYFWNVYHRSLQKHVLQINSYDNVINSLGEAF